MIPVSDPAEVTHVVVAAWHCDPCEVQGRSLVSAGVECWNCAGPVTVTAQPAIPIAEYLAQGLVPQQREAIEDLHIGQPTTVLDAATSLLD